MMTAVSLLGFIARTHLFVYDVVRLNRSSPSKIFVCVKPYTYKAPIITTFTFIHLKQCKTPDKFYSINAINMRDTF